MIAVTCRNGEHFTLDPDLIQRVENRGDTWVFLEDGTKYVVGQTIDELVTIVTDHGAAALSARRMLSGPTVAPDHVPGRPQGRPHAPSAVTVVPRSAGD